MTKMTKKVALGIAIEAIGDANAEAVEVLSKMVEQLDKRNSADRKPTKEQLFKDELRSKILDFLSDNPRSTCAAVADKLCVSLHSATGLLTTLRKGHEVRRDYEGKMPVYSLGVDPTYFPDEQ